jgi:hypothetical protein
MTTRSAADDFDIAIRSGAICALRPHAASIRKRAALDVTIIHVRFTVIKTSEADELQEGTP